MNRDDEPLAELYRAATRAPSRTACPSADEIAAALATEVDRERIADHAARCADCAEELAALGPLAPMVEQAFARPVRPPARILGFPVRTPMVGLLAAASLLLATSLYFTIGRQPSPEPTLRGSEVRLEGAEPRDGADLSSPPAAFAWSPRPPADAYRFYLLDGESTPLWTSGWLREPRVDLPPEVVQKLAPGRYFWRVGVIEGVRESRSTLLRFTLKPG